MKRLIIPSFLMIILFAGCGSPATPHVLSPPAATDDVTVQELSNRPNFVFILVDDLDLLLGTIDYMPHLQEEIIQRGLTLENFFITTPVCCPARVTFLKGQYTHNHKVYTNNPPSGGFPKFASLGSEKSTLGTWLQQAGYHTAFLGKYTNSFPVSENREYIPPGWDDWYVPVKGKPYTGSNYTLNINGKFVEYYEAPEDYITDVLTNYAVEIIARESENTDPYFIHLSYYAPHEPFTPAERHRYLFADLQAPRTPSFNEEDVSDKPGGIRFDPLLKGNEIGEVDHIYRQRVRAMQAVDEGIRAIVEALEETGGLENTYVIFTSDNGFHLGQHRDLEGKGTPYEEDILVPFYIRGPGIREGGVDDRFATNVDLAPTVSELAGVVPPDYVDGVSLVPIIMGEKPEINIDWRQAVLIEFYGFRYDSSTPPPEYIAIRTRNYTYVEYTENDFIELYDLTKDPYQLENIAGQADDGLLSRLSEWLHLLFECSGSDCFNWEKDPQN